MLGAGMLLGRLITPARGSRRRKPSPQRLLYSSSALLSLSVLGDSGLEHYRGLYRNRAMYVAPTIAAAGLAGAAAGLTGRSGRLPAVAFRSAVVTGLAGVGFHAWNLMKKPGRLRWDRLFYGAPAGAPAALALAGVFGLMAAGRGFPRSRPPPGEAVALVTAIGLGGNIAEVALLHFRGSYQNRFMYLPIAIPGLAAAGLLAEAAWPGKLDGALASLLGATAVLGPLGMVFHSYGVSRNMGGWANFSQNVLSGPPLAAPPSFSGLALAGFAALALRNEEL